jgi:hypothetical protein
MRDGSNPTSLADAEPVHQGRASDLRGGPGATGMTRGVQSARSSGYRRRRLNSLDAESNTSH